MPFSTYMRDRIGHAVIEPGGEFEAGSYASLTITYTAGHFGIDDTGALKISWRTASDSGKPQCRDPKGPNYTTAYATNGAELHLEYNRNNIRPWVNTLFIRVERGFLRASDQIVVTLGDTSDGSPGYRLQTACEETFDFKIFVDAFSTYDFVELPESPKIRLVPGRVARWKAILPTLRRVGEPFRLAVVAEDRWGNSSNQADAGLTLRSSEPISGLPGTFSFRPGDGPKVIEGLSVTRPSDLWIGRVDLWRAALGFGGLSMDFPMVLSPAPIAHVSTSPPSIPDSRISRVRFWPRPSVISQKPAFPRRGDA